ncbi:hypothetical protein [Rhodobacter capsulatus]|uniref:hypothetical protein n=1 Tax=Rhodobacter capsulatus TaxID=1061 RepID=UPI004024B22B
MQRAIITFIMLSAIVGSCTSGVYYANEYAEQQRKYEIAQQIDRDTAELRMLEKQAFCVWSFQHDAIATDEYLVLIYGSHYAERRYAAKRALKRYDHLIKIEPEIGRDRIIQRIDELRYKLATEQ